MDIKKYTGFSEEAYPDVFCKIPDKQPASGKPGQLTDEQLKSFFEVGFVIVENYFTEEEMAALKGSVEEIVEEMAQQLYKAGKIKNLYKESGLFQRLTKIEKEFPGANILVHHLGYLPQSVKNIWSSDKCLNAMEQILGTQDISCSPIWVCRYKTPGSNAALLPWHQDSAYYDKDSYSVLQATIWAPLLDCNEGNGTMQVVRGGHRKGLVAPHQGVWKDTFYLECTDEAMESTLGVDMKKDVVTCNIPYKGCIFLSNILPNNCLPNTSNDIRYTFEWRWQKTGTPMGFYDLLHGVPLRSSNDPDMKVDWSGMDHKTDLKEAANVAFKNGTDFCTDHFGPWFGSWPIVNENKHTEAYKKSFAQSGKHITFHSPSNVAEVRK